jgi:hypothetical protein
MSTILDTVVGYEDQIIAFVKDAKKPVVEYVAKGVDLVDGRFPEVTYPSTLPTPLEVVSTQVTFAKKMIDANAAIVTAVLETVAPVLGYPTKKVAKATAVKAA